MTGFEMSHAAQYLIAFVIILVVVMILAFVLRRLTSGRKRPNAQGGRSRQPRLGVVDVYDLDDQRQLVLLRRDHVEHLVMIGGASDVVIETSILRGQSSRALAPAAVDAGDVADSEARGADSRPVDPRQGADEPRPGGDARMETRTEARLPRAENLLRQPRQNTAPAPQPVAAPSRPQPEPVLRAPAPQAPQAPAAAAAAPIAPKPVPQQPVRQPLATPVQPAPLRPAPAAPQTAAPAAARPSPAAPAAPQPPAAAPEAQPQPSAAAPTRPAADASRVNPGLLDDMARQLEAALKPAAAEASRTAAQPAATPASPPPVEPTARSTNSLAAMRLDLPGLRPSAPRPQEPAPAPKAQETTAAPTPAAPVTSKVDLPDLSFDMPAPKAPQAPAEPVRPAPAAQEPAPAAAASQRPAVDPFSPEAIEAEFARLLGRTPPGERKS